jgi:hypothetical protein
MSVISASAYNFLETAVAVLNASVALFPHVAILSLLAASGAWWSALAGLVILLYGARRELTKYRAALITAALAPAPPPPNQHADNERKPNE